MTAEEAAKTIVDNEVYEASGSKMTATGCGTDLVGIAAAEALKGRDLHFIGVKVTTERTEVRPYPVDEVENKYRFIRHVEMTEKIEILKMNLPASYS